jgi:hypothetical protein
MTRSRAIRAAFLLAAILGGTTAASGDGWNGDANLLLGGKSLDKGNWAPTDRQGEIGVTTNWRGPQWPVALAVDLLAASRSASIASGGFTQQKAQTSELDLGVRKTWTPDAHFRPFAGGGLALASAEIDKTGPAGTVSANDGGTGIWIDGGVYWTLSEAFNLGFDVRITEAQVRLYGSAMNAGGFHFGLLAGYHWGR